LVFYKEEQALEEDEELDIERHERILLRFRLVTWYNFCPTLWAEFWDVAGSGENVSLQIFLLREYVSEDKTCLKRILRRENISEDISLKRKCI
jgi:hypothetical protein